MNTITETSVSNTERATKELIDAADYALSILSKIPAFGDGIGNKISKAQLGVAHNKLAVALTRCARYGVN